jgi:hypothetical protein
MKQVDEVAKFMEKPVYSYKANASDPSLFSRLDAVADLMNKTSASSLILAGQIDAVLNATFVSYFLRVLFKTKF